MMALPMLKQKPADDISEQILFPPYSGMREALTFLICMVPGLLLVGLLWKGVFGDEALGPFYLAAAICVLFGFLALVAQERACRQGNPFAGSLQSILLRTLGPLAGAVLVGMYFPQLHEHRIFQAFVCAYLLTLIVETILSVRLVRRWDR